MGQHVEKVGGLGSNFKTMHRYLAYSDSNAFQNQDKQHALPKEDTLSEYSRRCLRGLQNNTYYHEQTDAQ